MTDRIKLDDLTSDQYDALCDRLDAAEAEARAWAAAESADAAAGSYAGRVEELQADLDRYEEVQGEMNERAIDLTRRAQLAEAAIARVRALADDAEYGTYTVDVDALRSVLDEPVPGTAAAQATDGTTCTCGGRFPIHHLHADQHQPKETSGA